MAANISTMAKRKSMDLRYKQVEDALVAALAVTQKDMGAFRARVRHLRNLGLPKLPKPGSGRQISYTESQAFEMLIALELENIGVTPRTAVAVAPSIARALPSPQKIDTIETDGDVYAAVTPTNAKQWIRLFTRQAIQEFLDSQLASFSMINLSVCGRKLDEALERAYRNQ